VAEQLSLYRIHDSLSSSTVEVWSADLEIMLAIVTAYRKRITQQEFKNIERALTAAWNRVPLGYIARRFKYDLNYGLISAFRDVVFWRRRVFALSNIYLMLKKFFIAKVQL